MSASLFSVFSYLISFSIICLSAKQLGELFLKFSELKAIIVSPTIAIRSLLNQFVRAPSAVSLLLGYDENQEIEDLIVVNERLVGLYLSEVKLPLDTIIVSVTRDNKIVSSDNSLKIEKYDVLTLISSIESLDNAKQLLLGSVKNTNSALKKILRSKRISRKTSNII